MWLLRASSNGWRFAKVCIWNEMKHLQQNGWNHCTLDWRSLVVACMQYPNGVCNKNLGIKVKFSAQSKWACTWLEMHLIVAFCYSHIFIGIIAWIGLKCVPPISCGIAAHGRPNHAQPFWGRNGQWLRIWECISWRQGWKAPKKHKKIINVWSAGKMHFHIQYASGKSICIDGTVCKVRGGDRLNCSKWNRALSLTLFGVPCLIFLTAFHRALSFWLTLCPSGERC